MNRQRLASILKVTVTFLIVAFSIYFSVWKVDFSELGRSFRTANYWYALLIIIPILLSHYARALRWKVILERIHPDVRTSNLFAGVMTGYFMSNLIPRSGELVRPWFTDQAEKGTTYSSLLGSIIVERFIDTVALLIIIAAIMLVDAQLFDGFEEIGVQADVIRPIVYMAILLGVVFLVIAPSRTGLWLAETFSAPLLWLSLRFGLAKLAHLREGVLDMFRKLQLGFGAIRSLRQVLLVLFWTVAIYLLYLIPLYMMFFAFESGHGPDVTMFAALEIWAVTALGYAIAPTPGAFGVFHVTARIALMKFVSFSEADAVAYATLTHFINYLVPIVFGIYYLTTRGLSFSALLRARNAQ
ncbi:MAG: lysylphosphatidylglycerol synthase transmembrane domain-containing protein [Bacteroidota bacterium]|nr:lysylphosphatidylglycerol synthase transmembrane domain-containing protein [Bacteroidota bacterium]